jgi:type III restriction enzyme
MSRHVDAIASRMSLRAPQRRALELLDGVMALPRQEGPAGDQVGAIKRLPGAAPSFAEFERSFPNLCFALATGVGKTRLMGAFIAYLHAAHGVRNFLILAPNLTIYSKLVQDFTAHTAKYVFQGIADFAVRPPAIITGDDFEAAVPRLGLDGAAQTVLHDVPVRINIFNIAKIAMGAKQRENKTLARVRRLSEYLGQSYFEFLAEQQDLVVIMDEAHRYRADASMRTIEELRPMLGLELTATPQLETGGRPTRFKNVILDYPLAAAMRDGFVKEPAAATRANLSVAGMPVAQLERLKLEDGVRVHEETKVALQTYAINEGKPRVKPFMLVIARDTTHASELVELLQSPSFFDGRYAGKVIEVHSGQSGAERDEVVQQLLTVERPDNPVEIVVHVNMLKEGWDVTNLYTIVPLRAADSRTLVEQSIGRGLRLPYGKRVGVPAVDRLTIVAHEHFESIVEEAQKGGYTFSEVRIGEDVATGTTRTEVVAPMIDRVLGLGGEPDDTNEPAPPAGVAFTPEQRAAAESTLEVIRCEGARILRDLGLAGHTNELLRPEVQARITSTVAEKAGGRQLTLVGDDQTTRLAEVVQRVTELYLERGIAIPRVLVVAQGAKSGFRSFTLDLSSVRFSPVGTEIKVRHLNSTYEERFGVRGGEHEEQRLEDYVLAPLISYDDVDYEENADVLYGLASQVVAHLRGYLASDDEVRNVLQFHQRQLGELVYAQMRAHRWEEATAYDVKVSHGFNDLRPQAYTVLVDDQVRDFRTPVDDKLAIRGMLFTGFQRCLFPRVKFDSDSERRFAMLLETDASVTKWSKPGSRSFQIRYTADADYEPDFVVETASEKLLCEVKRADQLQDSVVRQKANAARTWCEHAAAFEREHNGKPWRYVLVPHDAIQHSATLAGLVAAGGGF